MTAIENNSLAQSDYLICTNCIEESYLNVEIEQLGEQSECSYCGSTSLYTITIGELADRVDSAFEEHYQLTSTEPTFLESMMLSDKESSYVWVRQGQPVLDTIMEAANIDERPAEHIRQLLEEKHFNRHKIKAGEEIPYDIETHYEEKGVEDYELQHGWKSLQESLKTDTRLFNKEAEAILSSVFEGLAEHETHEGDSVIVDVGPGHAISKLYRARVFQSDESLNKALQHPDIEMGPPPFSSAAAGRMNSQGISVFYGSTDSDVALAEIRPPVGSRVVVACFNVIRKLRLLNVEALREIYVEGSIFDSSYGRRLEKAKFLSRLSRDITQPAMPEFETADYLITQAISDYLANLIVPELDGIIYRSVQTGNSGLNVALFSKSSCVDKIKLPTDPKIEAFRGFHNHDYEDQEPTYEVWVEVPENNGKKEQKSTDFLFELPVDLYIPGNEEDLRIPTLELEVETMAVHHITSIVVESKLYPVRRYRTDNSMEDF